MTSPDNFNHIISSIMTRLGVNGTENGVPVNSACDKDSGSKPGITPSQALVIVGILGGVLTVDSVLVDRAQEIQIILVGSLKEKTKLEKMLEQIGSMSFDEVMKALISRLS